MTRRQAERAAWMAGGVGLIGVVVGSVLAPAAFPHRLAGGADRLARLAARLHGAAADPRADRRALG